MREFQSPVPGAGRLAIEPLDGQTVLRLTGELGLRTVPAQRRDVREIHLQLAGLECIDVAAVRRGGVPSGPLGPGRVRWLGSLAAVLRAGGRA